jgi:hypothetical protein
VPSLPRPEIVTTLERYLVEIRCQAGEVLHGLGKPVNRIVFPATCLVSHTVQRCGCAPVGVGMVARGGATGLGPVLTRTVDSDVVATVEIGGTAWALAAEDAARLNDVPEVHHAFVGLALAQLNEVSEYAFALGRLGVPARLAWWLLRTSAAFRRDILHFTHQRLADLIGVRRRATITVTLAELEGAGAVRADRHRIEITNREVLASFVGPKSAAYPPPPRPSDDPHTHR